MAGLAVIAAALLLATPLAGYAQPAAGKVPVIGLLDYGVPDEARLAWWQAFREALRELGYVEGRNIRLEVRWAQGRADRLPALTAELVGLPVDIIVTGGGEAARAAKRATATIPIVMATGGDPVRLGMVQSLARPGGNVTGTTSLSSELVAKRVGLLRELLPKVSRAAILSDGTPNSQLSVQEVEAAARSLGIAIHSVAIRGADELGQAFSALAKDRALIVVTSPLLFAERRRIADLALRHRLPTVVGAREYAEAGGLLAYAVDYPALFRRAATYVDRILKGAKPGDLPVEQPSKFELVVNLRTAKALGLTVPRALVLRADHLIE